VDWVLRNALVVDGTGSPGFPADVAIAGGRIAAVGDVGDVAATGAREVELDGLVLAPGFIDVHTHYDAQVLWDPDLTSSAWHGVTSVVMGNCGFGVAPARPEHRELITRTLENVEGMSAEALEAGITWDFETIPEYLRVVEARPKRLNVGALIGHTAVRLEVMGEAAVDRFATSEEVARMAAIVAEAIEAGALGFATSKNQSHNGAWGRPVASRASSYEEVAALADALGRAGRGVIQATYGPGLLMREFSDLAVRTGRPVTWTALLTGLGSYGADLSAVQELASRTPHEVLDYQASLPGEVWPQIACRPLVSQMTLRNPGTSLKRLPAFKEVLGVPVDERRRLYADPDWRNRARDEVHGVWARQWRHVSIQETEHRPDLRNVPFDQLPTDAGDPFDLMVDTALGDDLRTRFRVVALNDDEEELAGLLRDRRAVLGLSDAGAHVSQLYDACFSTHLLGHWVRERQALTLEEAVWRLTSHAATVFRIPGRGVVQPGWAADLVAFDPATVGVAPQERVWDLPGGADRLIARSLGIEHVWVNGHLTRRDGEDVAGAHHGVLLRPDPA
jgi:N-acyl-D-aspartate/D-glutamate deacylase